MQTQTETKPQTQPGQQPLPKAPVPTDIEIAQNATMKPISEIAEELGLSTDEWEGYGKYKAKLDLSILDRLQTKQDGRLILVTAINPTAAGEGKTTVSTGLAQALNRIGKKTVLALREPSLGPVFGLKGGATGGGYSQVVPMEDINLHFTGDFHAITSAHNLLAAILDNHLQQGNTLGIDPRKVVWRRALDMNDRSLRDIVIGLGGKANGVPREDGFDITVASEIMAILCLAKDLQDLKQALSRMLVAYTYDNRPVYAGDLQAEGAMAVLLKDAVKPNLVQTLENTPALIHGGPFANIAHGCNSLLATKMALKLGDYAVTEAGFGADLGAEKFLDIKCRKGELQPSAVVIVATIRALKLHGGMSKDQLKEENLDALKAGFANLEKHVDTITRFGLPFVVALNHFHTDTQQEVELFRRMCGARNIPVAVADIWGQGGAGGEELAQRVVETIDAANGEFHFMYDEKLPIAEKLELIARNVYGADGVQFTEEAQKQIKTYSELGWDRLPICVAKTQYSLSDDPKLIGQPKGFTITVREIKPSLGAGFLVALTGSIMRMPGLPKRPAALGMDIDEHGSITGLF